MQHWEFAVKAPDKPHGSFKKTDASDTPIG